MLINYQHDSEGHSCQFLKGVPFVDVIKKVFRKNTIVTVAMDTSNGKNISPTELMCIKLLRNARFMNAFFLL